MGFGLFQYIGRTKKTSGSKGFLEHTFFQFGWPGWDFFLDSTFLSGKKRAGTNKILKGEG